jgi:hypothetical protein
MVNPNRFYTYAYLREDKTPYYIGKGTGDRIYSTNRRNNPPKDKSRIIFLKQNLTEEEAFRHEIYMIAVFGRKDLRTGILHNLTDGGDGASGYVFSEETRKKMRERTPSEETRKKMSEARKGEKNHNYGKIHSEETRRKMSEAQIGKTLSKEHIDKIIEGLKGRPVSEETRRKMSEALIGNTRALGKSVSEETRRKISEYHKNKYVSEETRRKIGAASKGRIKGRKWWNDGCGNRKMMLECPGDGWRLGRK